MADGFFQFVVIQINRGCPGYPPQEDVHKVSGGLSSTTFSHSSDVEDSGTLDL
jgi:hypothetical protein